MLDRYVLAAPHARYESMRKGLAARYGDAFYFITDYRDFTIDRLRDIQPRYIFLPHWSRIIPSEIHSEFECVVFHMTDLPFGRGGSPLQNLISRGIYETQISALRCVTELDSGPIYLKRPFSLHGNAEEIYMRASCLIEVMINEIILCEPEPEPQQGEPTNFNRRRPEQSNLSELPSLRAFYDHVRMLDADGYPKAFVQIGRFRLELSRASLRDGEILADVRVVENEKS